LTAKLMTKFKQQIEQMTLVPSGGGCFELKADGELLYSKLKSGQFPDEQAVLEMVGTRLKKHKK
jgi:selenoprotein W-related protein